MSRITLLSAVLALNLHFSNSQSIYFPPVNNNLPWDTVSPSSLGWCEDRIPELYRFLEGENSKAFIVLKDGRIVLEKYFGSFTRDSTWYWASAGKTITAFLTGKAREEKFLSLDQPSSDFLGKGWTSCTPERESAITIRHQLTMTTGLDDGVPDNHCTDPACLVFKAAPGTRWAYHNAPYTLLEKVLENSTGININTYTQGRLKTPTGITGLWLTVDFDNVFFSKPRSMARFGLLVQNHCIWNRDTLLRDTAYVRQMTNTSQPLNESYGYLWWLNGKNSYMLPTTQVVFRGSYAPFAPQDMYAALGKNGQILSISPSKGLVIVRMGNEPNSPASDVPTIFCNQIWSYLNNIMCTPTNTDETGSSDTAGAFAVQSGEHLKVYGTQDLPSILELLDLSGHSLVREQHTDQLELARIPSGAYLLRIGVGQSMTVKKIFILADR